MVFTKIGNSRVYVWEKETAGAAAYMVTGEEVSGPDKLSLKEAWSEYDKLYPSFVFLPAIEPLTSGEDTKALEQLVREILEIEGSLRGVIWLQGSFKEKPEYQMLGISADGTESISACTILPAPGITFQIQLGCRMKAGEEEIYLEGQPAPFSLIGGFPKEEHQIFNCSLSFVPPYMGRLSFQMTIAYRLFLERLCPGIEYAWEQEGKEKGSMVCQLFEKTGGVGEQLVFQAFLYPPDLRDEQICPTGTMEDYKKHRTYFRLTEMRGLRELPTGLETIYGQPVSLFPVLEETKGYPARFTLSATCQDGKHVLCPEGDFSVVSEEITGRSLYLLCGLSGTEAVGLYRGDRLRFLSGQKAYAYELEGHSFQPGEELQPDEVKLTDDFRTSWMTVGGDSVRYCSEPKGYALYGTGGDTKGMLIHRAPEFLLEADSGQCFPLFIHKSISLKGEAEAAETVETKYLEKLRRMIWGNATVREGRLRCFGRSADGLTYYTTPSGLLAGMEQGIWRELLFASAGETSERLYVAEPDDALVEAFQSENLFLVMVNPVHMAEPAFHNQIYLSGWRMHAQIGYGCSYGKYGGVMLWKCCQGRLYNPQSPEDSLVYRQAAWSYSSRFSTPEGSGGEVSEQALLAVWLMEYFKAAYETKEQEYFSYFNAVATNPDWRGILFLKLPMNADDVPQEMRGLFAGVKDASAMYVHHLGINLTPVEVDDGKLKQDGGGALFGLIYYQDSKLSKEREVVCPDTTDKEEFRLLELKVLFEASAVKSFRCRAQLSLPAIWGIRVKQMGAEGNPYYAVPLTGYLEERDGVQSFLLNSTSDAIFEMENKILEKVVLNYVGLSTRSKGDVPCYQITLAGHLELGLLCGDIFSYKHLAFSNACLMMDETEHGQEFRSFPEEMQFDLSKSILRKGSLGENLNLKPVALLSGESREQLESFGYDEVEGLEGQTAVSDSWLGLRMKASLGTLGELAENMKLETEFFLVWEKKRAEDRTNWEIRIRLPGLGKGGSGLELQNILKLSVASFRLIYEEEKKAYALLLGDISLKVLGVAKLPPSGSIDFAVFGGGGDFAKGESDQREPGWYAGYRKEKKEG